MQESEGRKPAFLYIQRVAYGSGAERAGLREQQRITKINGRPVKADDLGKLQAEQALRGPRHSEVKVEVAFWNQVTKKEETMVAMCRRG